MIFAVHTIVIGPEKSGKSSLIQRSVTQKYTGEGNNKSQQQIQKFTQKFNISSNTISTTIIDTPSSSSFVKTKLPKVFSDEDCHAVFLTKDSSNENATCFDDLEEYYQQADNNTNSEIIFFLVLTKIDSCSNRPFLLAAARQYMSTHPRFIDVIETSAKTGENVNESTMKLAELVISRSAERDS